MKRTTVRMRPVSAGPRVGLAARAITAALALASAAFALAASPPPGQAAKPAAAPASSAAPQRVQRTRAVTMTRFVKVFTDLEYDLIDALRLNDKTALDRLVSPEFEQRESAKPAEPLPRDDWVKSSDTK